MLADLLSAVANPTRLALLRQLRRPHTLGEIRILAGQPREGLPDERTMARQGVRLHIDKLLEVGFLRSRTGWRSESEVEEFLVDHQRLFALVEEIRQLVSLRPIELDWSGETMRMGEASGPLLPAAPCLVLVHGLTEGKAFPLAGADGWIIGRQAGLAVTLDHDPFVSSRHATIVLHEGRFEIREHEGSKNGTAVNWRRVGEGRSVPLSDGDVVSVGKSLLVVRGVAPHAYPMGGHG